MNDLALKQRLYKDRMTVKNQNERRRYEKEKRIELESYKDRKDKEIDDIHQKYKTQIVNEEIKLAQKLEKIRSDGNEKIQYEEDRYKRILSELEINHENKFNELELSFQKKTDWQSRKHQEHLDEQYKKYKIEKEKYNS